MLHHRFNCFSFIRLCFSYTSFATDVAWKHYKRDNIAFFLAYGPMTNYYQALVEKTVATLQSLVFPPHSLLPF